MAGSVEELLDLLYTEIEEAKNAPLNNDRCVIERDRVLDMIDDVKAELPVEIKRAKDLVANRNDYIASAKREAEAIRRQVGVDSTSKQPAPAGGGLRQAAGERGRHCAGGREEGG